MRCRGAAGCWRHTHFSWVSARLASYRGRGCWGHTSWPGRRARLSASYQGRGCWGHTSWPGRRAQCLHLSASGKGFCLIGDGADPKFAFLPTTPYSKGEKGGRQRLRVVGLRCSRRADRLRLTASSTNVQAEDATIKERLSGDVWKRTMNAEALERKH